MVTLNFTSIIVIKTLTVTVLLCKTLGASAIECNLKCLGSMQDITSVLASSNIEDIRMMSSTSFNLFKFTSGAC